MDTKREPATIYPKKTREATESLIDTARESGRQELNLSDDTLPESISRLRGLKKLSAHRLSVVPESIEQLINLEYLDLSGSHLLTRLPESIGRLVNLRYLNISNTQVKTLPESIGQLTRLQTLDLSLTGLWSVPEALPGLTGLLDLSLSNNNLTTLPDSIAKLTQLRRLVIVGNQLTALPNLRGLQNLQALHVSANNLDELPTWLGDLHALRYFSASSLHLKEIPQCLTKLANLKLLCLSDNPLGNLPKDIANLRNLEGLNLSANVSALVWEPDYHHWTDPKEKAGRLRSLPNEIKSLEHLSQLYLHGQQHLKLPPELLGPPWEEDLHRSSESAKPAAIFLYYFRTHGKGQPAHPLNEAKMILVGRGGVGKTSLVNRLVFRRYNSKERKTDGISISPWRLQIGKDYVRLNVWDFGGQEIMHATHQFFLTKRSLYLLVLNAREGEQDANIEYWMRLIESFGGDSPVIIVVNKIADHMLDLNRRGLKDKFPAIRDFVETDCEAKLGLEKLRKAIKRETSQLRDLHNLFPAGWLAVKEKLANLRHHENRDFISFSRYQELCAENGVRESDAQNTLVGFLHDLGIVVNFRDDPRLAETHVLNPDWVTNGIYKILNAKSLRRKRGELELAELRGILDTKRYPRLMHLFLMDLMRKFELCYEYYENAGHYLVPQLLGKEEVDLEEFETADALRFEYRYNILPEGLLPRFIVRARALNEALPRWRTGVVLEWEGNRAAVEADVQDRYVSITIVGPGDGRRRLLEVIRADFEHIHRSIARLEAIEQVPVRGHPGLTVPYESLSALQTTNDPEMILGHQGKSVHLNVSELLREVEEVSRRLGAPTIPSVMLKPVRIAFSYSHKDEPLRDRLETHLKLLERRGYISTWFDRKILPGDKWKDVIDENFKQTDLIVLLISADFIASDYCYEIEMKTALERDLKHKARVVPVILRACKWTAAPFGRLEALPKNGKPVTSWRNRDEAWNDVAEGLQKAIEDIRSSAFPPNDTAPASAQNLSSVT